MGRDAQLGQAGEDVAVAYLRHLGWRVLDRNWRPADRTVRGELDVVAIDGQTVVVCEVKTRRGTGAGVPAAAVTPRKLTQLRRLAAAWLAEHPGHRRAVRVDVVGLVWPPAAVAPTIEHHRDVVG